MGRESPAPALPSTSQSWVLLPAESAQARVIRQYKTMEAAHLVRSQVFGYIRSAQYDEEKVERLKSELMAYGKREGLTIVRVFVDNGGTQRELLRPGLGALLEALNRERVAGVVVPALWHLSWRESVREYVLRQFEGTGVWVVEAETRHGR